MFKKGHQDSNGRKFILQTPPGEQAVRAVIEEDSGESARLWIHLVWQEDWTSPTAVFAKSKFIKGKIVYQKDPKEMLFYAREYCIRDNAMTFSSHEDGPFSTILPDDT